MLFSSNSPPNEARRGRRHNDNVMIFFEAQDVKGETDLKRAILGGWDPSNESGQIIATSHDLTPNGGDCKGNPIISGK